MDFEFIEPSSSDPLFEFSVQTQKITIKTEISAESNTKRMICLLCYDSNEESIVLDSEEGRRLNVSPILFKYFQFCFAVRFQSFVAQCIRSVSVD